MTAVVIKGLGRTRLLVMKWNINVHGRSEARRAQEGTKATI